MKICKKCIQPNTRPGIFFDENGVCGACLWHQEKNKINWSAREEELHKIASNLGIEDFSGLKKQELIIIILDSSF